MKVYKTAICSLLTYGSEAWHLDETISAMINGANARLLSRFTGKDAHTEASARTRSYDLVRAIQVRRLKWLGHIMRMKGPRLVKIAIEAQHKQGLTGDMFDALPRDIKFRQIHAAAQDRKLWKNITHCAGNIPALTEWFNETPQHGTTKQKQKRKTKKSKPRAKAPATQPYENLDPRTLAQLQQQFPPLLPHHRQHPLYAKPQQRQHQAPLSHQPQQPRLQQRNTKTASSNYAATTITTTPTNLHNHHPHQQLH